MGPRVGGVARGKLLCRGVFARHVGRGTRRPRYCPVSKVDDTAQTRTRRVTRRVVGGVSRRRCRSKAWRRGTALDIQQDVVWCPGQETQATVRAGGGQADNMQRRRECSPLAAGRSTGRRCSRREPVGAAAAAAANAAGARDKRYCPGEKTSPGRTLAGGAAGEKERDEARFGAGADMGKTRA